MAQTRELANKALGGKLRQRLARLRAERVTYDEIAERLRSEGIDVSRETVRRWVKHFGINDEAA